MGVRVLTLCAALAALGGCSASSTFKTADATGADGRAGALSLASGADPSVQRKAAADAEPSSPQSAELSEESLPELAYVPSVPQSIARTQELDILIAKYAAHYGVPLRLVHRVVNRESTYRPGARNGIHLGLMQINPQTARTMGYSGPDIGLFDAETNLKYGVKYLRGAYLVAQGDEDRADKLYQTGYYYHAKRMGLLKETGLRP